MTKGETYTSNLLTIDVKNEENQISIIWSGRSKDKNPSYFLTPILTKVLDRSNQEGKKVIMDFRSLEYMNSSTITPIIKILERVRNGKSEVLIQYKKSLKWQELTFCALEVFQTKDQRVLIEGI